MIKKALGALALVFSISSPALAFMDDYPTEKAPDLINDMAALQNGAKQFVNYCLNCHSADAMMYNKLTDIGLTEEEIRKNLLFTSDDIGSYMTVAMDPEDGKKWFGTTPPDLSVIARSRATSFGPNGVDYLYTYLRSFYRDQNQITGWNNLVYPMVAMPHVMWESQGPTRLESVKVEQNDAGEWVKTTTLLDEYGFWDVQTESVSGANAKKSATVKITPVNAEQQARFDKDIADLSNFLGWMAEPYQTERKRIGTAVLILLLIFFFVAWRLDKAYWKDVK
ncbi:MAG TPA: cytochrome c1 [Paenalcaligenes sp.]|nr:cytochrome c1 [Paenalcaligenes sp.]